MNNKGLVGALIAIVVIALVVWGAIAFFDVDVTEGAELPRVEVEGGNMPEVEVDAGEIEVKKKEIDIPDSITVPDVDVKKPEEEVDLN